MTGKEVARLSRKYGVPSEEIRHCCGSLSEDDAEEAVRLSLVYNRDLQDIIAARSMSKLIGRKEERR